MGACEHASAGGCGVPVTGAGLDRRAFLQVAGAGLASTALPVLRPSAAASALSCGGAPSAPAIRHFVPADKKLPRGWPEALVERGTPAVYRGTELDTIAMPVGGIAAGQLYLRGDGTLGCWQIFNGNYFSGYGAKNYEAGRRADAPVDQGFAVCAAGVGAGAPRGATIRRLHRGGFREVEFVGEYPIGTVRYRDAGFPLGVELEAFSPFIPLNARDSAMPASVFQLRVSNTSGEPVEASVIAWLENAVCIDNGTAVDGVRRTRIERDGRRTMLVHDIVATAPASAARPPIVLADFEAKDYGAWTATGTAFGDAPAAGTLATQQPVTGFLGAGLVNSFLGGDAARGALTSPPFRIERRYLNFLIGGGGHAGRTCVNLVVDDRVVRTAAGRNEERLAWHCWDVGEFAGREACVQIVDRETGAWGHINADQFELSDAPRRGLAGPLESLPDYGTLALAAADRGAEAWDGAARPQTPDDWPELDWRTAVSYAAAERYCSAFRTGLVRLDPGQSHVFAFVLAWHFPNAAHGCRYAEWFDDAAAVARYVLDNLDRLTADTRLWHDTYYDGTLPRWLLDRIGSTLCNLATGTTQWRRNGRFWAWEGVGCCHGTCTHVWNYAQGLARLFPELERSVREMQDLGEALHPGGLVGFRGERNNAYAADGQAGTVLKCYREHLVSADGEFLKHNWPRIQSVLTFLLAQDRDDDGLLEGSQHNTYDINFEGPNTFVGSLYLAALRAGEEMARRMGEPALAERLHRVFERGRAWSGRELWNGEYFVQRVDLAAYPRDQYGDGCLSDQLFGQAWAEQLGLGYLYRPEQVRSALRSVWRYNWAPDVGPQNAAHPPERWFAAPGEAGLFVCTWPKSPHLDQGVRYRDEVWTGIEYQVAAHLMAEGMTSEGLAMIRAIHDRYHPSKRNPFNEVECGDHYARALASWGVLIALAGFEYDGPAGRLGLHPRITPENFRCVFTAAEGWGTLTQSLAGALRDPGAGGAGGQTVRLDLRWGRLRLRSMGLTRLGDAAGQPSRVQVVAAGRAVKCAYTTDGRRVRIEFAAEVTLTAGQSLEIRVA